MFPTKRKDINICERFVLWLTFVIYLMGGLVFMYIIFDNYLYQELIYDLLWQLFNLFNVFLYLIIYYINCLIDLAFV